MASTAKMALTDVLALPNSSVKIPRLGLGVYQATHSTCITAVQAALKAGYRHVDSAQFYRNEAEVGEAVRTSSTPRKDVFITTKVISPGGSPEATYQKLIDSVEKVDPGENGYVDCFLIHNAACGKAGRKELWLALERLLEAGKTRSIGVSNYGIGHIEEMKQYAKVWPPHINQIELHPWCQQRDIVRYCEQNSIVVQAYCPLVRNYKANEPTLVAMAQKYNKNTGQILIRYSLQKGWNSLPKSENPERIVGNADVFGFEIGEQDMAKMDALDQGAKGAIVQAVKNDST